MHFHDILKLKYISTTTFEFQLNISNQFLRFVYEIIYLEKSENLKFDQNLFIVCDFEVIRNDPLITIKNPLK